MTRAELEALAGRIEWLGRIRPGLDTKSARDGLTHELGDCVKGNEAVIAAALRARAKESDND